ncbi:MAG TPA: hypothetical protein VGQ36_10735 [Thermoanaerobaculia bacterium]|nr:hypothetical protein [Thermoanaerobaculia bacterium]
MLSFLFLVLWCSALSSCQGRGAARLPSDATWPHTIEGKLEISVEDGDVDADDLSELNFGSIRTTDGTFLIHLDATVIRQAGLRRDQLYPEPTVRAELSGPHKYSLPTAPTYRVSKISIIEP